MYAYILKISKLSFAMSFVFLTTATCFAQETQFTVFEVRKRLPMSNDEKPIKDYYVSNGVEAGLKVNMVIDVKRKIPIHDGFKNTARGSLEITVGKLKIIHVDNNLSVGRVFYTSGPQNRPITGFETIMIGDYLDIKTAAMIVPKSKRKSAASQKQQKRKPAAKPTPKKLPNEAARHAFVGPQLDLDDLQQSLPVQVH